MGNQQCCVSSQPRDMTHVEHFCNSPSTSGPSRFMPQASSTENPPQSNTLGDQLNDSNSVFYKAVHTDFPITSSVTPDEEARALASKKKKKLRRKKPPPLEDVESPREYSGSSNTFFLTTNFDKAGDHYTETSYKITTTQGEGVCDGQEGLPKKVGADCWENEEDKNLSVRLSDKRRQEKYDAENHVEHGLNRNEQRVSQAPERGLEAGIVVQKKGEDDEFDDEIDADEERLDQRDQKVFKVRNELQNPDNQDYKVVISEYKDRLQLINEDRTHSRLASQNTVSFGGGEIPLGSNRGHEADFVEEFVAPNISKENSRNYEARLSLIQEEADSMVNINLYSINSNSRRELSASKNKGKESRGERTATEETTWRYPEYRSDFLDNTLTAVKQNTLNRESCAPVNDPAPFNISERESAIRAPERPNEGSVVHFSRNSSPHKEQRYLKRYEDYSHSPERILTRDQTMGRLEEHDESVWNIGKKVESFDAGNSYNPKIENQRERRRISIASEFMEGVNPLREKSVIINDEVAENHLYHNHKFDYHWKESESTLQPIVNQENSWLQKESGQYKYSPIDYKEKSIYELIGKEKTGHSLKTDAYSSNASSTRTNLNKDGLRKSKDPEKWESVQNDVQKLIDKAFKPRTSLLDVYLNVSKGEARKSMVHKPTESWKDQLEKRTEYANPFSGN